jgi:signal transduction histidine kinase
LLQGTFTNSSFIQSLPYIRIITYMLFNLSIPASTSVFLALDFAYTNQTLQRNLVEVETLSKKTLLQEQEKQQIQASQNEMLEQQVHQRTMALKKSLEELKATQAQLIQKEKMASLGELTAGIAHEIQNPLNFVNNFSETNVELLDELQAELKAGNMVESIALSEDIKENEQKINVHGKRADAIVKGMLQHSRQNTGIKEPTGINALADEYLRIAFHGIRAKDKSFTAKIETHFDESIGKVNIVPQDIGRVLLNLFNNAFYSVAEKAKKSGSDYQPTVEVCSRKMNGKVEVLVRDNGTGIPQHFIDKIFQPFFTSKPTGQGTGLGLSLAFDIVKSHGGELKVESKEDVGATFIISISV